MTAIFTSDSGQFWSTSRIRPAWSMERYSPSGRHVGLRVPQLRVALATPGV